jgi:hypothetical protein
MAIRSTDFVNPKLFQFCPKFLAANKLLEVSSQMEPAQTCERACTARLFWLNGQKARNARTQQRDTVLKVGMKLRKLETYLNDCMPWMVRYQPLKGPDSCKQLEEMRLA